MKEPRKHHYVAQGHLSYFGSGRKGKQIWVFDKRDEVSFKASIGDVAAERDFYSVKMSDAKINFEPNFSPIEARAFKVFRKIVNEGTLLNLSDDDLMQLAGYISFQFCRSKGFRHMYSTTITALGDKIERITGGRKVNGQELPTGEEEKFWALTTFLRMTDELVPLILLKNWVLQYSQKHSFLISDNPVVLHNHKDFGPYGNLGFAVTGIEIYMPISPQYCLSLYCPSIAAEIKQMAKDVERIESLVNFDLFQNQKKQISSLAKLLKAFEELETINCDPENVTFLNHLQVRDSHRFLFSKDGDFSLPQKMISDDPKFKNGTNFKVT
ncbi:MAG: DUF4238 domain-containing protein [Pusillimonas sp.]